MIQEDTVKLLRECNAGIKMGVSSLDEVLPKVQSADDQMAPLKGQEFRTDYKSDLLFGGIGFVTVPEGCVVKTYTPDGIGLGIRRALI